MTTTISKPMLKAIRPKINAALEQVAREFGLEHLACGNGNFDPRAGTFTIKLEGRAPGGKPKEAVAYEQNREWLKLPPLGYKFATGGEVYATSGINTTATKVYAKRVSDDKAFLFKVADVVRICGKTAAALGGEKAAA
ncbi:MAG TPA: hypothetical protein VI229_00310 [Burkholderiales bacterium]